MTTPLPPYYLPGGAPPEGTSDGLSHGSGYRGGDAPGGVGDERSDQVSEKRQYILRYVPAVALLDEKTLANAGVGKMRPMPGWTVNAYGWLSETNNIAGSPVILDEGAIRAQRRRLLPVQVRIAWQDGALGGEYIIDGGAGITVQLPPARSVDVSILGPSPLGGAQFAEVVEGRLVPALPLGAGDWKQFVACASIHPDLTCHPAGRRDARMTIITDVPAASVRDFPIPPGATRLSARSGPLVIGGAVGVLGVLELGHASLVLPSFIPLSNLGTVPATPVFGANEMVLSGLATAVRVVGHPVIPMRAVMVFRLEA